MGKLLKNILKFVLFFLSVSAVFVLIDLHGRDFRANNYLNQCLEQNSTEENIVIGSSKVHWHFVDSLIPNTTILSDGGQYNYACLSILYELEEADLLNNKTIWLDLQDASEIKSGFGKWWYFNEAFMKYGFASFADYPIEKWPKLMARFYVDAFDFRPNKSEVFHWKSTESVKSRSVNEDGLRTRIDTFLANKNCSPLSEHFQNPVNCFVNDIDRLEKQHNCKIYFLILPAPNTKGCLKDYLALFGKDRTFNLIDSNIQVSDFHDNNHMNTQGALKVTEKFNAILKQQKR